MSSGEPLQGDERRHETWRDEEEKGSVRHAIESPRKFSVHSKMANCVPDHY